MAAAVASRRATGGEAVAVAVLSAGVWTLALVAPKQVYPRLTTKLLQVLKNPALTEITKTDLEITATPEGELYNKEVIKCRLGKR